MEIALPNWTAAPTSFPRPPKRRLGSWTPRLAPSSCLPRPLKGLAESCCGSDSQRAPWLPALISSSSRDLKLICHHLAGKRKLFLTRSQNPF